LWDNLRKTEAPLAGDSASGGKCGKVGLRT